MNREEVYTEIKEALGMVPGDSLEMEWDLFKRYVLQEESKIRPKYRELIC